MSDFACATRPPVTSPAPGVPSRAAAGGGERGPVASVPPPPDRLGERGRAHAPRLTPAAIRATTGALFARHRELVTARLEALGLGRADAEELCADTFMVAMRRLPAFEGRASLPRWLLGIARKLAADHRRSARARLEVLVDEPPELEAPDSPLGQALAAERRRLLREQVAALRPPLRRTVETFWLEERPMAEHARCAGLTLNAAYGRLYTAQRGLKLSLSACLG